MLYQKNLFSFRILSCLLFKIRCIAFHSQKEPARKNTRVRAGSFYAILFAARITLRSRAANKMGIFHLQNQLSSLQRLANSASFGDLTLVDLKERFCQPPFYDFLVQISEFSNLKTRY